MSDLSIRPRFKFPIELSTEEVFERLKRHYSDPENRVVGKKSMHHVYLNIPQQYQHYWSPMLNLSVSEEEGETIVRGLMGPKPKVWAMFLFMYAVIILVTLFGGMYGLANMNLGIDSNWGYCFPIGIVLFAGVYLAAGFGQKKGHEQMVHLRKFVDEALDHVTINIGD